MIYKAQVFVYIYNEQKKINFVFTFEKTKRFKNL